MNATDTETLLLASIELAEKDEEIVGLKQQISLLEARIAIMECKLQRSRLPFSQQTPALLRRQAE